MNKARISALLWVLLPLAAAIRAEPALELRDAWVRALPPTQPNTAAYLVVANAGSTAQTIVGASADLAGRVEIHTMGEVDGYMRMQQLESLEVPAASEVALSPGGTHLMLLDLERMPEPGQVLNLCLELASGEQACAPAEVRRDGAGQGSHHQHH